MDPICSKFHIVPCKLTFCTGCDANALVVVYIPGTGDLICFQKLELNALDCFIGVIFTVLFNTDCAKDRLVYSIFSISHMLSRLRESERHQDACILITIRRSDFHNVICTIWYVCPCCRNSTVCTSYTVRKYVTVCVLRGCCRASIAQPELCTRQRNVFSAFKQLFSIFKDSNVTSDLFIGTFVCHCAAGSYR